MSSVPAHEGLETLCAMHCRDTTRGCEVAMRYPVWKVAWRWECTDHELVLITPLFAVHIGNPAVDQVSLRIWVGIRLAMVKPFAIVAEGEMFPCWFDREWE